jgi:ABC-type proline/glycine betaine transport system substrate-binding protein
MSETDQRDVIKFLDARKFALDRIVAELASVDGEHVHAKKAVEYWIH